MTPFIPWRSQLPGRLGRVQGRGVSGDAGVEEEEVLGGQVQPVQRWRERAASEKHAGRSGVLARLHARAQVAGEVVAVVPREVRSR